MTTKQTLLLGGSKSIFSTRPFKLQFNKLASQNACAERTVMSVSPRRTAMRPSSGCQHQELLERGGPNRIFVLVFLSQIHVMSMQILTFKHPASEHSVCGMIHYQSSVLSRTSTLKWPMTWALDLNHSVSSICTLAFSQQQQQNCFLSLIRIYQNIFIIFVFFS